MGGPSTLLVRLVLAVRLSQIMSSQLVYGDGVDDIKVEEDNSLM